MTDDLDLDRRLRTAGSALDDLAAARVPAPPARRRSAGFPDLHRPPRVAVAAAVVAFALVAVGAAVVLSTGNDDAPTVDTGPTTVPTTVDDEEEEEPPTLELDELPDLGATGLLVAADRGLVSLATGETTPLLSPADPFGTTAPTAIPDGKGIIFYISHQGGREPTVASGPPTGTPISWPELRRLSDGRDTLVEAGVTSVALRADGTLAMAVGADPAIRQNLRFQTDIVVVAPDGTRTTWSTGSADQQVVAWAGDRLLTEKGLPESESRSLHVMEGPGRERELSPQGRLLAVGPDGRWVAISGLAPGDEPLHDAPYDGPPQRVVDLVTGDVIGLVALDPPLQRVVRLTWSGDDRLIGVTALPGTAIPVLVELAVAEASDGTVTIGQDRNGIELDPDEVFVPNEVWAAANGSIVALTSTSDQRHRPRLIVCPALEKEECEMVEPPFGHEGGMSFVANPSRPLPR